MPKKIDPKVKERCVRQVLEHLPEYPSLTAAAEVVARREGVGKESCQGTVGLPCRRTVDLLAGGQFISLSVVS